jgi:hypothetical protein
MALHQTACAILYPMVRRRMEQPTAPNPISIMAQVAGSGTGEVAAKESLPENAAYPPVAPLTELTLLPPRMSASFSRSLNS